MILVINAGSSSLKAAIFAPDLTTVTHLNITAVTDHAAAVAQALVTLAPHLPHLTAIAHRVVHGGATLTDPVRLTPASIAAIRACIPLAPLHNPANLAAIEALTHLGLPQFASFDTAFHASIPTVASTYALPATERSHGLRRYGFHGLSYASLIGQIDPLPSRLLAFHLGNGASLCAILHGQSVATSMGFSPTDGLTMGSRVGSIDPMAVLDIARRHGIPETARLLNHASGLIGLAGTNDMASLLARTDAYARFAIAHFCHHAACHAGAAIIAMGGLDAVAFTGGIGENAAQIRDRIMNHLAFLGPVPVHVIKAAEERQIARDALALLSVP